MEWYEIVGIIVVFALGTLSIIAGIAYTGYKYLIKGIALFVIGVGIILSGIYTLCLLESPSATIEVDGYVYELQEEPPEQYIERGGHTYVLQGGEYDTNS